MSKLNQKIHLNRNRKLQISRAKSRDQLIHKRLTRTKLIGSSKNPESQAGRQSDGYGGWCLELRWGGRYGEEDEHSSLWRTLPLIRSDNCHTQDNHTKAVESCLDSLDCAVWLMWLIPLFYRCVYMTDLGHLLCITHQLLPDFSWNGIGQHCCAQHKTQFI